MTAAAANEWTRLVDSVLRGVAHTLNNRGAALAALVELTSEPAEQPAVLREILDTEQQRVRELVQALRTVGTTGGEAEALLPDDVIADVVVVLGQHPDLRDGAIQIVIEQRAPVRVARWMFARALLALAAGLAGGTRTQPRRLSVTTDDDWLVIGADDRGDTTPVLAGELARAMHGEPLPEGRYGIRLPTLAALRRREGR